MTTLAIARQRYAQALAHDVQSVVEQLRAIPEVALVILFGSYAIGRCDLFTDLDVLVVMPSPHDFVTRNAMLARRLRVGVALDLSVTC